MFNKLDFRFNIMDFLEITRDPIHSLMGAKLVKSDLTIQASHDRLDRANLIYGNREKNPCPKP